MPPDEGHHQLLGISLGRCAHSEQKNDMDTSRRNPIEEIEQQGTAFHGAYWYFISRKGLRMNTKVSFVTAAVFSAFLPALSAQAQSIPQLCKNNVPAERWNNCFGQLRVGGEMLYSGRFIQGVYEGFGTLITPDGTYSGEFRNGKFEGQGVFLLPDGNRYAGGWRAGLMDGNGRIISADGIEFVGVFANGQIATAVNQSAAPPLPAPAPPKARPAPKVAEKAQPTPPQPTQPVAKTAPAKAPAEVAAFIPSREWDCSTGYYPYVSYSSLVTSGNTYKTSWRDGSGANSGKYSKGSTGTSYGGLSIKWDSGTWAPFIGEYVPAGTAHPRTGRTEPTDLVLIGEDQSYYPTSCYPK
jgi:hypothetical protein